MGNNPASVIFNRFKYSFLIFDVHTLKLEDYTIYNAIVHYTK